MSIGPTRSIPEAAAGSPLAQTTGPEVDRTGQELAAQRRREYYNRKAGSAAGVSEPDGEDHQSAERDADGRQPREVPPQRKANVAPSAPRQCKDYREQSGNLLDLTG